MFEKEAKEYANKYLHGLADTEDIVCLQEAYKDGAEYGFQKGIKTKVNTTTISDCPIKDEWHKVADGDLPDSSRFVWTNLGVGYYDDGWFDDFGKLNNVIAWCEPKYTEEK